MGSHCRPAAWVNSFGVEFFSPGGGSGCCSEDETLEEAERKMGAGNLELQGKDAGQ
jgi:hypothetical protein